MSNLPFIYSSPFTCKALPSGNSVLVVCLKHTGTGQIRKVFFVGVQKNPQNYQNPSKVNPNKTLLITKYEPPKIFT
jgi:hypothetical protein